MLRILLITLSLITVRASALSSRFQVGEEVIYQDSAARLKGTVVDVEPGGGVNIEFGNWPENLNYGHQPNTHRVRPYRHAEELLVRNIFYYPMFTLKIGQPVIYKDSVTWMRGVILDLTEDGLALVDFHNDMTNKIYGWVSARKHLTPAQ
jgi:hypothetical protein